MGAAGQQAVSGAAGQQAVSGAEGHTRRAGRAELQPKTLPVSARLKRITVCDSAQEVGKQAAEKLVSLLETAANTHGKALLVLACAPSQHETWEHLIPMLNERPALVAKLTFVNSQSFSGILKRDFFAKLNPPPNSDKIVLLKGDATDANAEAERISDAIKGFDPNSIVVMGGFGTDGHLAFDDYTLTGPDASGKTPLVTVRKIKLEARMQQVTEGLFNSIHEVPTHCITLTNHFFRVWARGGIVLAAKGAHKRAAADTLAQRTPRQESPVTLLYQETGEGDMPCTPDVFLDPKAGAGIAIAQATPVRPAAPCRVIGCGKLPIGLLWQGIQDGQVYLTTSDRRRADTNLPTTLEVSGLFNGEAAQASFEVGTFHPDFCGDLASALELAVVDKARGCTIVTSNNQEYFSTDSEGRQIPSDFAKNMAVYLAKRFQIDPQKTLQIAPLELFPNNGERLYDAVLLALQSADVGAHLSEGFNQDTFKTFLKDTCCWYNTIDDRIVTDRDEQDGRLTVKTEPYATLHFAKAAQSVGKHLDLESPFVANGTTVQEVQNLEPYSLRKLGLLNAVHVCAVIECLRGLGINSFQDIKNQEQIDTLLTDEHIVRNLFNDPSSESFNRIDSAAKGILEILNIMHPGGNFGFDEFLQATYKRFANPYIDHKLRDIFQGMDKFRSKIMERIGLFIVVARRNPKLYGDILSTEQFASLVKFYEFDGRNANSSRLQA